jgi:hypothetical protein
MGRPIYFDFASRAVLSGAYQLQTQATISILEYVLNMTAERGADIIIGVQNSTQVPLVADLGQTIYTSKGIPGAFSEANLRYIPTWGDKFIRDIIDDERPATVFCFGPQSGTDFHWLERGMELNLFQCGGTARHLAVSYFVVVCDYTLIMEELFTAGAYLSQEPDLLCTVAATDIMRYVLMAIMVLGTVLSIFGIPALTDLIGM